MNGTKQRTVLAALLRARARLLSDYELGKALWGENPPGTYKSQIYTYASRMRQRLGDNAELIRRGSAYQLRLQSANFDFDDFLALSRAGHAALEDHRYREAAETLRQALDLWRGPTLADVTEHLAQAEAPAIEEARTEALESRIAAELALGRHNRLIADLVELVTLHPLRERLRAQLMLALYESGRQADAFAVFHEGRRHLRDELGVDPGPALRDTYQAIVTGNLGRSYAESRRGRNGLLDDILR